MVTFEQDIRSSRNAITRILKPLLPAGSACALAGYPDHWNVGDTAIWRGTRGVLRQLNVRVRYACDPWSYNPRALEAALPEGPILLCGGGNFGDVYLNEVQLRHRILSDFPQRRIIQLPQSIWFREASNASAMAQLLKRQADFTLLVRDNPSLELARAAFDVQTRLCPDLALMLDDLPSGPGQACAPLLELWREDIELQDERELPDDADWKPRDWLEPGPELRGMSRFSRAFLNYVGVPHTGDYRCPKRRALAWRFAPALWEHVARERVLRGCRLLLQGRVVITNRLHAHLLCVMLGIPHVICDTSNGKLSAYRDSWPLDDPRFCRADSPGDALVKARTLPRDSGAKAARSEDG